MFNFFFEKKSNKQMKGYKITNIQRNKKYGIAANSLQMLVTKSAAKFKIKNAKLYLAKDGTEVQDEEYFSTIEPQSLFVVAEACDYVKTDFELLYEVIRNNFNVIETGNVIQNFVNQNKSEFNKYIKDLRTITSDQRMLKSSRKDHGEWFKGQPQHLDTKEKVMCRRSQDRIRGYYYKTKDDLTGCKLYKTNAKARKIFETILEVFKQLLMGVDYFSSYFNRDCKNKHFSLKLTIDEIDGETPRKKLKRHIQLFFDETDLIKKLCVSLCTNIGEFACQGIWNQVACQYTDHSINPYASRENAILFQIWNLDHRIEISRSIIPSLIKNVQGLVDRKIICVEHKQVCTNVSIITYFFEIFTIENLKLVHIVCHDKGAHELKSNGNVVCENCDEAKFVKKFFKEINM